MLLHAVELVGQVPHLHKRIDQIQEFRINVLVRIHIMLEISKCLKPNVNMEDSFCCCISFFYLFPLICRTKTEWVFHFTLRCWPHSRGSKVSHPLCRIPCHCPSKPSAATRERRRSSRKRRLWAGQSKTKNEHWRSFFSAPHPREKKKSQIGFSLPKSESVGREKRGAVSLYLRFVCFSSHHVFCWADRDFHAREQKVHLTGAESWKDWVWLGELPQSQQ